MGFLLKLFWLKLIFMSRMVRAMFALFCMATLLSGWAILRMPGSSYDAPLPPLSSAEERLKKDLQYDVNVLASRIGERNLRRYAQLQETAEFITYELQSAGYQVIRQPFTVKGKRCENIIAEIRGVSREDEVVIIGAHYDTAIGSPGADDNSSGVAVALSLARFYAQQRMTRTLRLVFLSVSNSRSVAAASAGSAVYARHLADSDDEVILMLNLASLGYFTSDEKTQHLPVPLNFFYPKRGNFIAFAGQSEVSDALKDVLGAFRSRAHFPSQGILFPDTTHLENWRVVRPFWKRRLPAVIVTDTGIYRNPHLHKAGDRAETLDYSALARVTANLQLLVNDLVRLKRW